MQWKHAEREIAARLGGVRVPINGRGDAPDVDHDWLAIEVKHRKSAIPKWLQDAHHQAQKAAAFKGRNCLPVSVLHVKGQPYDDSIVQIRLADFVDWFVR